MRTPTIGPIFAAALALTTACTPCSVFGPLQQQEDERELILRRAQGTGISPEVMNVIAPPLTADEVRAVQRQNASCRASYLWKNGIGWTGGVMIAVAAGVTIGGAYATGNNDQTGKIAFGVSAGSLAALGGVLGVAAGMIHQSFTERGCVLK